MQIFLNLTWGQTRAWCLESAGWGTDGVKGPNWFSLISFQGLMHSSGPVGRHRQLILVLEGELYLIPFALLKGSSSNEYLYERFSLIAVPSIQSLNPSSKVWHCLIKPLSHRTSPVECRFLYMLEKQQLCPATPDTRIETINVPPSRSTPSSNEHVEHHSCEVDSNVVPAAKNHNPRHARKNKRNGSFGYPHVKDIMSWGVELRGRLQKCRCLWSIPSFLGKLTVLSLFWYVYLHFSFLCGKGH